MRHAGGMGLLAGKDGWVLVDEMVALRTSEEPWEEEEEEGIAGVESDAAVVGDAFVANERAMEDEYDDMATVHVGRTWPFVSRLVSPGVAEDSGEDGGERSRVDDGEYEDNDGSAASWPSSGLRQPPYFHPWGGLVAWGPHYDMSWPCLGA